MVGIARPRSRQGFSLVELLVAIAIIVVIAGLLVGVAIGSQQRAMRSRTKGTLAGLKMAIENYRSDCLQYPEGDIRDLVRALSICESDQARYGGWAKGSGQAVPFEAEDLDDAGRLVDGWRNAYICNCLQLSYELYSCGPDGIAGTEDDVRD